MIASTPIAVLPVARSPMISSRWPRPIANKASTTRMPVCHRLGDEIALDDRGRRALDRHLRFGLYRLVAVERPPERIDDAAEQSRPDRDARRPHRSRSPAIPPRWPRRHRAAPRRSSRHRESARNPCARLEAKKLVETGVRQTGDEGDPVADAFHATHCLGLEERDRSGRRSRRLRASQGVGEGVRSVCVMVHQFGLETNEIRAEAVAHDRVRGFQFDAGDERGIDRDSSATGCPRTREGVAAGLVFFRGHRAGSRQIGSTLPSAPTDARAPSGSFAKPVAIPSMKADTRASRGNRSSSLAAISTASRRRPIFGGERFGAAFGFDLRLWRWREACPPRPRPSREGLAFAAAASASAAFKASLRCSARRAASAAALFALALRRRLGGFCVGEQLSSRLLTRGDGADHWPEQKMRQQPDQDEGIDA